MYNDTTIQRFWAKVNIPEDRNPDTCWEWRGYVSTAGYARVMINRKRYSVHRFSYILTHGEIEKGLFVCHSCDNPSCCNPSHLWLGTALDNSRDMVRKGRSVTGIKNNKCKLSVTQVEEIRKLRLTGMSMYRLAKFYNVSRQNIRDIVNHETWKNV